jgi:adenylate cyclase
MASTTRRLAAILAADIAGYSRLMGADEVGTVQSLREHRSAADPLIAEHGGRVVKTTGDGLLIEFGSVVGAVECALGLQRLAAERNAGTPAERRMEWRIGIHIGDVLIEGDDILGDGVNIAARLEGIAEPGGICLSDDAFRQVRGKVEAEFVDQGEQSLKNITRPLRVYRVGSASAASQPISPPAALPLPEKPSIAVLPFANLSGDPEQEYFVDGMVEEIITVLSRIRWLFVIARNSSFSYKGQSPDVRQVGRELGVRYVLEGSVRKGGSRVRITAQLIDAQTGAHLWADRFDGALDDIFELQDRVASSVVGAIEPKLRQSEIERAVRKPTQSLDAYDLYLRALAHYYRYTEQDYTEAVALLRQALAIDPSYGPPAALIGWCHLIQRVQGWGTVSDDDIGAGIRLARQALEAGRDDPDTMVPAACTLFYGGGETALAEAVLDRALTLNPNSALGWMVRGFVHAVGRNQPAPAIEALERALRLSPFDPLGFVNATWLAQAHLAARNFEKVIEWADRALHDQPRFIVAVRVKIIALAYLGRLDQAHAELGRMLALYPGLTIAAFRTTTASFDPEYTKFALAGLRLAGLPEE